MIRTQYEHGAFSWADLGTKDPAAAKQFYGGLFGWSFEDFPAGPGTYSMAKVNPIAHQYAAGLYLRGLADVPGSSGGWSAYITVDDVDARTRQAVEHGGKVAKEPFEVLDKGRMSVLHDPSGATICLWQAKKHIGAAIVQEPGTLCWNELFTTNVDVAEKFYAQTLGWKCEKKDMGSMGTYTLFQHAPKRTDGANTAGMMAMPPHMRGVPSHWVTYFAVKDCDASTKKANELGGKTVVPPMDIPHIGRFSIVQDPQGATFGLFTTAH